MKRKRLRLNSDHSGSSPEIGPDNKYLKEVAKLEKTIPNWEDMFCEEASNSRIDQLIRVEVIGQSLCDKYAWAIPDERSLRVLSQFSPLIEIGCGKGYWAYLLKLKGVDIIAFDKKKIAKAKKSNWTDVQSGGPEVLLDSSVSEGRNLLLCYPDEASSLAIKCLENFTGDHIIHVGELAVCGGGSGTLSSPQAPWGRTTGADFQVSLAEEFHCLLTISLPRYPFSRDCLSVWKRTQWVEGKPIEDSGVSDTEQGISVDGSETTKDNMWANIPKDERMPVDCAAPCLQHLL